jgi:hypothetical protein
MRWTSTYAGWILVPWLAWTTTRARSSRGSSLRCRRWRRRGVAVQHERYRAHRAVRVLLEQLAEAKPLVLMLDDFHWADSASAELLGARLRRPPAAAVLLAVARRPSRMPGHLASALERAHRRRRWSASSSVP